MKTIISIDTISLPNGSSASVRLLREGKNATSLYVGDIEYAGAIYAVLQALQSEKVDLAESDIWFSETRS